MVALEVEDEVLVERLLERGKAVDDLMRMKSHGAKGVL
jgi:hypothetical protein